MSATPDLDRILQDAHLPALVLSLVHMTGDASLLKAEWQPTYNAFPRGEPIFPPGAEDAIRAKAKEVLSAKLAGTLPLAPPLSPEATRKMINFIAGAEVPAEYLPFLQDELAIDGESSKNPKWETPVLKGAASKLKVLVIGAGMSGMLTSIRLNQAGISHVVIEENADVGGTWLKNTYPGCRVDNSNHMYSYSFEQNHAWPFHFSPQPVLLEYFQGIAAKYDLKKNIRFHTTVLDMAFDEARDLWRVRVRDNKTGAEETIEANAVVTAVGQLNRPRMPDIKGRDTFKGPAFHSAEWRHDVDLTGKRVGVIGTGASAYQFVPEIAGKVKSLTVFQRTPPWAFPVPHYHETVPDGMKWLLEHAPMYDKWYRFFLFWMSTDGLLQAVRADEGWNGPSTAVGQVNQMFREMIAGALAQAADDPALAEKIIPTYPLGGKRGLLDNGVWLEALKRPNVELTTSKITEINETGIKTEDGTQHDFDVLIYGTGFHASKFLMPMKIKGRGGRDLHETWAGEPRAYLGMTTPGFPNLFMIYGPNTNIVVNGSIIFFSECSVRYIVNSLKLLAETGAGSMEVRQDVHDAFNVRVDAENAKMAWGAPQVTSWYKNETGRVTQNWPFALVDYWRATLAPDPKDFTLHKAGARVAA